MRLRDEQGPVKATANQCTHWGRNSDIRQSTIHPKRSGTAKSTGDHTPRSGKCNQCLYGLLEFAVSKTALWAQSQTAGIVERCRRVVPRSVPTAKPIESPRLDSLNEAGQAPRPVQGTNASRCAGKQFPPVLRQWQGSV
jgi:hypothetical protein